MSKTLKYDPRSASPQYLVISGEWISIGKGLKLIWQLTVIIGIHIRWLSYGTVTSINTIVVRYATCVVSIKIHPWVVTDSPLGRYFWVRLIEIDNILYNRVMALDSYQNFVSIYPILRYWNANNCSQFWYLWGHLPCSAELRTLFIITRACAGPFLVLYK